MWTINDFSAYSMMSGWSTAGKTTCPHCMEDSDSFRLSLSRKQSWFDNHRKFLPLNHDYRRNTKDFFRGKKVNTFFKGVKSGHDILRELNSIGLMKVTEVDAQKVNEALSRNCSWYKRSIFWDLPYLAEHLLTHNLDVMHIEKNVFENIFNTVLNIPG